MDDKTEIASGFTVGKYLQIRPRLDVAKPDTDGWRTILDAFNRRIRERFLRPARELAKHDKISLRQKRMVDGQGLPFHPGAAILALDCLLIDTIQSFREGRGAVQDISPARSFKDFLRNSKRFSTFTNDDRADFFGEVRNGLLHNGETRGNWKIRIDSKDLITKSTQPQTRIINRRIFHACIAREFRQLCSSLKSTNDDGADIRKRFLNRMDAICEMNSPQNQYYFAYGSNLLEREILKTVSAAEGCGKAFLPRYRLVFSKHSVTRQGDAASIQEDAAKIVWGFLYRVDDAGRDELRKREKGYREIDIVVSVVSGDDVSQQRAFTFVGEAICPKDCGPSDEYLNLIIEGTRERGLPNEYWQDIQARYSAD